MAKGLVLAGALAVLWVAAQLVVVHTLRPTRLFNTMTLLFAPTVPLFVALYALTPADLGMLPAEWSRSSAALGVLNGLLVLALLYGTWVEGFYYVDRPVTLRVLVEFVKAPGRRLTLDEVRAVYGLEHMITSRLETMRENALVEQRDGRWVLTRKGFLFARGIRFVRSVLGLPYYFDTVAIAAPKA